VAAARSLDDDDGAMSDVEDTVASVGRGDLEDEHALLDGGEHDDSTRGSFVHSAQSQRPPSTPLSLLSPVLRAAQFSQQDARGMGAARLPIDLGSFKYFTPNAM
jgi:hypothetical protein